MTLRINDSNPVTNTGLELDNSVDAGQTVFGTTTDDSYIPAQNTGFEQLVATNSRAELADIATWLGLSPRRARQLDRQAIDFTGSLSRSGLLAAPVVDNELGQLSTNERVYLATALTRFGTDGTPVGGFPVSRLLANLPANNNFAAAFDTAYEKGWVGTQELAFLFDPVAIGIAGLDGRIADMVDSLRGDAGQRLRGDLAVTLVSQAGRLDGDRSDERLQLRSYAQGVARLTKFDSATTLRVVENLANDGHKMGSFMAFSDEATRASFNDDVNRMTSTLNLRPEQQRAVEAVRDQLRLDSEIPIVTGEVDTRRQQLQDAGAPMPEDTPLYDTDVALRTVMYGPNLEVIEDMAAQYGIDPALLAGVVASEIDFDLDAVDIVQDGLGRRIGPIIDLAGGGGGGTGITSTQPGRVRQAIRYLQDIDLTGADRASGFDLSTGNLATFPGSIEAAAIMLSMLQHHHQSARQQHPDVVPQGRPNLRTEDMAIIFGAFRNGVGGLNEREGQGGYQNDREFAANLANDADRLPGFMRGGGNAFQSEPIFRYFDRTLN